jgi:hypothetical protein
MLGSVAPRLSVEACGAALGVRGRMHSHRFTGTTEGRGSRQVPRALPYGTMPRGYPTHIQRAFDELRFGPSRTLNLRDSLPTPEQARARVEAWVRGKQVERAEELLIVTGRGNNSAGGVSVVRQAVVALFPSLRRRNIITGWTEHTPGSFVVTLAPVKALFEVIGRRRERNTGADAARATVPATLAALSPETLVLLRRLAVASLEFLGVHDFERFVDQEMTTTFAALSATLSAALDDEGAAPETATDTATDPEEALRRAIRHALDELEG